jgi:hypothetical protein
MAAPTITAVTPPDGFTSFPTGEKIEILFDQEISEFLLENSLSLVGPDNHIVTGIDLQESRYRFSNESSFSRALDVYHLAGEVLCEISLYKTNADGVILEDQNSYLYDPLGKTKVVIRPRSFLQEKTKYRLIISGSAEGSQYGEWAYVGSRSVYDPEADASNSGNGLLKSAGNYSSLLADKIIVTVIRTGSSTTCRLQWYYESNPSITFDLFPLAGRNKLGKNIDIYLELIGGASDAFTAGDQWEIALRPVEYLSESYKLDFETAADQVKELPTTVSQSPIKLDPNPSQSIGTTEEFQIVKFEPEYGSSNISLNTSQIIVTFNKNIDPTSITADSVRLFRNVIDANMDQIEVGYSWIVSGKKLIINITRE